MPSDIGCTMNATYPKRLIEVDLLIKRISANARREKSIRHGHISTLHIWWARRPLAACRAVVCAALWPDPADPACPIAFRDIARKTLLSWSTQSLSRASAQSLPRFIEWGKQPQKLLDNLELREALMEFLADFSNWDNSYAGEYLEACRSLTQAAHESLGGTPGTRPLVVDPFAGGGSIPLEALRVGADAFASDLNPVPVLLNKVLLEYIPKYGRRLSDEVRRQGQWIKEQSEKDLKKFYPDDSDGAKPIAFLWARTALSEAPGEGDIPVEIPLIRSLWLAKRGGKSFALRWKRSNAGEVCKELVDVKYADGTRRKVYRPTLEVFRPRASTEVEPGTSRGGAATCPISGYTTSVESVRRQLAARAGGAADARLICVVTVRDGVTGREYRSPVESDIRAAESAASELRRRPATDGNGLSQVPDGKLNHLRGFFNIVLYGMTTWGDLFSPRQKLSLTTLNQLVHGAGKRVAESGDSEFARAVQACLALAVSRHADINASLAMWHNTRELITHVFGRQALPMVWDFAEANTFSEASGSFLGGVDWICRVLEQPISTLGTVEQASATAHPMPDDSADIVFTDPPYYAAIPYADLSDFFYSWLRRALVGVFPVLFHDDLSPKELECVSLAHRAAMYRNKDAKWFESMMTDACREARRISKPSGVSVFVFANKETSGWEAMLMALISSGWTITASWPIDTEMGNRLRARNSAALASSIHLVCRPRVGLDTGDSSDVVGDWRDVLMELPVRIHEWMPRLAAEGVVGADAIFACIGPALEIFSRFTRVEKASGEQVALKEFLEEVWAVVAKEALTLVFSGADTAGFEEDGRLTAIWLWTIAAGATEDAGGDEPEETIVEEEAAPGSPKGQKAGFVLPYDAARKIAQGLGANLDDLVSLVEVSGEQARLLPVVERTKSLFRASERDRIVEKNAPSQQDLFDGLELPDDSVTGLAGSSTIRLGDTVLDRIHQAMVLFAAGRSEALKRFLITDGGGQDQRFWLLAQALSALYPTHTDEKRWVDGVLARKKVLGF